MGVRPTRTDGESLAGPPTGPPALTPATRPESPQIQHRFDGQKQIVPETSHDGEVGPKLFVRALRQGLEITPIASMEVEKATGLLGINHRAAGLPERPAR